MTHKDQDRAHARLDDALEQVWSAAHEAEEIELARALSDLELLYQLGLHERAHGCYRHLAEQVRDAARGEGAS